MLPCCHAARACHSSLMKPGPSQAALTAIRPNLKGTPVSFHQLPVPTHRGGSTRPGPRSSA
eukprot:10243502-Alexandrium_andersonii.AAC.1